MGRRGLVADLSPEELEERRAYHRAWRAANKDKVRQYDAQDYEKNKPARQAAHRDYAEANPRDPEHASETNRAWREANSDRTRESKLRTRYGLTLEQYEAMLQEQNGCCAICEGVNPNGRPLYVDHCHTTGTVRKLLCQFCNTALGNAKDNPVVLRRMADYLEGK